MEHYAAVKKDEICVLTNNNLLDILGGKSMVLKNEWSVHI